jgi:hypothetical protein
MAFMGSKDFFRGADAAREVAQILAFIPLNTGGGGKKKFEGGY